MKIPAIAISLLLASRLAMAADPGGLEIHEVADKPSPTTKEYTEVKSDKTTEKVHLEAPVLLDGSSVKSATVSTTARGQVEVTILLTDEGAAAFGKITSSHVGKRIAMVVGGQLRMAPVVNEPILGGQVSITGSITDDEAKALAELINKNAGK